MPEKDPTMELKTTTIEGVTYAVVQDGKPVYIENGKEIAFDAVGTRQTISRLNGEAQGHREAKENAEKALKAFEGLDAAAARDAIDKLSKIDAKKLVEAGDMDAAIQAAIKPYVDELNTAKSTVEKLTGSLAKETIGNKFSTSKYAAENLTPAGVDLVRTIYADRLKVEDGKVIGLDQNGNKLFSRANPGNPADFDEIIEAFVDAYPHKDHILKGSIKPGGGAAPGWPGAGGKRQITRSELAKLSPAEAMQAAREADIVDG